MEDCLLVSDQSHVSGPECQFASDRLKIEFVPMETMNRNGLPDDTIQNLQFILTSKHRVKQTYKGKQDS